MAAAADARGWIPIAAQLVGLIVVASFFLARIEGDARMIAVSMDQLAGAVRELKTEVVALRNFTYQLDRRLAVVEDHDARARSRESARAAE